MRWICLLLLTAFVTIDCGNAPDAKPLNLLDNNVSLLGRIGSPGLRGQKALLNELIAVLKQ